MNTINAAIASANRYARAIQIIKEGYKFTKDVETGVIAVCKPGRLAASYWINVLEEGCDCPDYMKTGRDCKHMLAWSILEEEEAGLEAQCAEYDARQLMEF